MTRPLCNAIKTVSSNQIVVFFRTGKLIFAPVEVSHCLRRWGIRHHPTSVGTVVTFCLRCAKFGPPLARTLSRFFKIKLSAQYGVKTRIQYFFSLTPWKNKLARLL
jgi:hypothetical protein